MTALPGNRLTRRQTHRLMMAAGALTLLPGSAMAAHPAAFAIGRVRTEWQNHPLGIDTLRPRFHWTLTAHDDRARGLKQTAAQLVISDSTGKTIFDSGRMETDSLRFQPETDLPLQSQSRYLYSLQAWDQTGRPTGVRQGQFSTGLLVASDARARWIGAEPTGRHLRAVEQGGPAVENPKPMPEFTRDFDLPEKPVAAHLCVVGLGQYQLYLNDRKVSPDALNGQWTDFDRRVDYDCYDLTALLQPGPQQFRVALGNGFFNVEAGSDRYVKLNGGFGQPQMWLQLRLTHADGRETFVVSDDQWRAGYGATRFSSIYGGEDYDARIKPDGFPAFVVAGPAGRLSATTFIPMKVQKRLTARKITAPVAGALLFDFGVNHSGRPDIRLKNTMPGQVITLYPSELLTPEGTFDQKSMAGGKRPFYKGIKFTYICKGAKEEAWSPQFCYTGYRYIQTEGVTRAQISMDSLFMYDAVDEVGTFTSTDTNMVAIHRLIRQALLSNLASVITDCPHREKLGWLEQLYLNAMTALMNVDAVRVYEKMTADMRDTQEPSGQVISTAPEYVRFTKPDGSDEIWRDSAEWGASLIMSSWYTYKLYGDPAILTQNYAAMQARVAYMETRLDAHGLIDYGMGDWLDIGQKKGGGGASKLTSKAMTGTATFYMELITLGAIAARLGRPDSATYAARAEALKATLQKELFHPETGAFDTGSQCAQAMAVVLGLAPQGYEQKALDLLIADIRLRNDHVTAGDIGFHYVVRALSENGRGDVLHAMLSRSDAPSYLDQINKGATALTEVWDSQGGSHNHFMLGHAEIWLWSGLGGINIDYSQPQPLVIAPQPVAGVEATEVTYDAVFGRVVSGLSKRGKTLTVTAEIPPGMTATVKVPCRDLAGLREGGRPLDQIAGVISCMQQGDMAMIRVGSGRYAFRAPI